MSTNNIVHALWIGNTLSQIELLTIYSFIRNGHTFNLWVYNEVHTNLPEDVVVRDANEIMPEFNIFSYKTKNQYGHGKGSYAGFSDIFRYKLLYEHGGWWTDMDVTCLKPLDFEENYVFRSHHELDVVGNIMKCPKNSELMKRCYEQAVKGVDADNTDWNKPIRILNENIQFFGLSPYIKEFTNMDSWLVIRKLLKSNSSHNPNWYAIHWVNEEWRRNGIRKDYCRKGSVLCDQYWKYGLSTESLGLWDRLVYNFRLTLISAVFKILPYYLRGFLRKHFGLFYKK